MIAAKLSVSIPVAFAFSFLGENATYLILTGIGVSLLAIVLSCKTDVVSTQHTKSAIWLLSIDVFLGSGAIDTVLNLK